MKNTINKSKYPFPVAAVFLLASGLTLLLSHLIATLECFYESLLYGYHIGFYYLYSTTNVLSFITLVSFIALAVILFFRKPTPVITAIVSLCALLYALGAFLTTMDFIDSILHSYTFEELFEEFDYIIEYILFDNYIYTLEYFANFIIYSLNFIVFALLIPISANTYTKKRSRFLSSIWIIPGLLSVINAIIVSINSIITLIDSYTMLFRDIFGIFSFLIPGFYNFILVLTVFFLGHWLSRVSRIRSEEDDSEKAPEIAEDPQSNAQPTIHKAQVPAANLSFIKSSSSVSEKKGKADIGVAEELIKYKSLLDNGVITEDEFKEIKNRLLNI